jgi:adenosine kinase
MSALICGSMAFDNIMVFPGKFKDHILPDKIHILNVAFLVPTMRRNFGGCAGNIAYNLKLLGGQGAPMATVGHDFAVYRAWMEKHGVEMRYIKAVPQEFTAQAFITTDLDDNQITAFHPGAMNHSHTQTVPNNAGITLGLISPDGRDGMIQHADQFVAANIPFIFDPGQGLPMFDGKDLLAFIDKATYVTVNDYEGQLISDRTGLSHDEIAKRVKAMIVTRGGEGSTIYTEGKRIDVPCAKAKTLKDPTGCGDAYRAGLIFGLMKGYDWQVTGRIASLIGTIKIESEGPQNHSFTMGEFAARYKQEFGFDLKL